jgi:hypothetical protein
MTLVYSQELTRVTEVPIRSFSNTKVSSVIRIETHDAKNKVFKPQVPIPYLTHIYIIETSFMPHFFCIHQKINFNYLTIKTAQVFVSLPPLNKFLKREEVQQAQAVEALE